MSLKFSVVRSAVGKKKYRLAVQSSQRLPFERFLEHAEKATTISAADIEAVLRHACDWVVKCTLDGETCDLGPMGGSWLGAKGMFDRFPDRIEPGDFDLTVTWVLSPQIRKAVRSGSKRLKYRRVIQKPQDPVINSARSLVASMKWQDTVWKAGATLHLRGDKLKFDPDRKDEGVFLIPSSRKQGVRVSSYHDVFPKNLRCTVPRSLNGTGNIRVEVRRRSRPHDDRPRVGKFARVLKEV